MRRLAANNSERKEGIMNDSNQRTEIVVYSLPNSDLHYKDGKFISSEQRTVSNLNRELKAYDVDITTLVTKDAAQLRSEGTGVVFTIRIRGEAETLRDFLVTLDTLIATAYIKPTAEDPGR